MFRFAALVRNIPLHDKYLASYVHFKLETHTKSLEIDFTVLWKPPVSPIF
jgi:hypothetical protein